MSQKDVFSLATEVVELARAKGVSLCTAESCTGGMIAEAITSVSGASSVFLGALVTYDERMKAKWLGVREQTLSNFGAVSAQCAAEMAQGAREASGAAVALSVTGFAGPLGGTERDPVGTVYLCISKEGCGEVVKKRFFGTRDEVRRQAAAEALQLFLQYV
ncbi:MAG: CinA family protein [Clostridia bacterium]|nr:CinA family protein [Clostridia bacterium]